MDGVSAEKTLTTFKKKGKHIRVLPPSKLALKRTLRRSSMYDKLMPSIDNSKLNVVDADSTETTSYTSSLNASPIFVKPRKGFIIVNDSVCETTTNNIDSKSTKEVIVCNSTSSYESLKKKDNKSSIVIASTDEEAEAGADVIPTTPEDSPDKNIVASTDEEAEAGADVIPATPEDSPDKNIVTVPNNVLKSQNANELLSQTKYDSIKKWVESIERPDDKYAKNTACDKPSNTKVKQAINSTFALDKTCLPFHEWMKDTHKSEHKKKALKTSINQQNKEEKKLQNAKPETPNQMMKRYLSSPAVQNLFPKESPVEIKKIVPTKSKFKAKSVKNTEGKCSDSVKKPGIAPVRSKLVADKNKENLLKSPTLKQYVKDDPIASRNILDDVFITPAKQVINQNDDVASLLDTLYGNSWHKNKAQIFSEPRPQKKIQINKLREPRTEKKPQCELLYKNPYLDSEKQKTTSLLKTLQKQRIQVNLESPFFKRPTCVDNDSPSPASGNFTKNEDAKKTTHDGKEEDAVCFSDSSDSDDSLGNRLKKKKVLPAPIRLNFIDEGECDPPKSIKKKVHKRIIALSDSDSNSDKDSDSENKPNSKKNSTTSISTSSSNECGVRRPVRKATPKQKTDTDDLADRIDNITIDDSSSDLDSDDDFITRPKKGSVAKPKAKPQTPSFLSSLSKHIPNDQCDPSALIYKSNYKKHRDALTKKLFDLFNEKIFDKCISPESAIEWSVRMTGTAGLCRCLKRTSRDGKVTRTVKFQLSSKVLDSADRLRDTLVHEMCHAATYLINEVSDGHGPYWKAWAAKAMRAFPELPPIKRCHDYAINHKYTYKCTSCGYSFGRHSKSLDVERKRCGYCYGTFEVLLNKTSQHGAQKSVPCTPRKEATGFAKFIKDNYALHKSPGVKHADLMKFLGKKYADIKGNSG